MASFSVALPISRDSDDGFTMLKSFRKLIKQNLKMLLLTAPGERVMEPEFGVGMRNYLFENFTSSTYSKIETNIRKQASIYMPNINIQEVQFSEGAIDQNRVNLRIVFSIPAIGITEMLELTT
jgi:phage baseplate assembly protein W